MKDYIIKKLIEQNLNFIRFRYEFKREMIKLKSKIDIYFIIILGSMIFLARVITH